MEVVQEKASGLPDELLGGHSCGQSLALLLKLLGPHVPMLFIVNVVRSLLAGTYS